MNDWTLKMKDLCAATGLSRQAIHYYVRAGLMKPGRKTGRNMAFYGPEHLERLQQIRRLQHERFLPLKAIKALLNERDETIESYSAPQRAFLQAVRSRILSPAGDDRRSVPGAELVARGLIEADDLEALVEDGVVAAQRDADGAIQVHADDVALVDLFGQLRGLGISEEAGFAVEDLGIYDKAVTRLLRAETALVVERLGHRNPDEVAALIERSVPVVNALISHLRERRIRDLLATL